MIKNKYEWLRMNKNEIKEEKKEEKDDDGEHT